MSARYLRLPAPERYDGPDPCRRCAGARVLDGRTAQMSTDAAVLVVDVICPDCDGCGRATHDGCREDEHGTWDHDYYPDDDTPAGEVNRCPFCAGRRWIGVLAWGAHTTYTLRMPCGCATDLLVEVAAP
ncbi:hypothetical protein AB0N38_10655 [Micromonospora aurantiaca]|uniref:hypothetical protein n=1 Tax=Micromonospora aurantiaca (nom. illeg.) TaxID=47850 RepID=UPI00341254DD